MKALREADKEKSKQTANVIVTKMLKKRSRSNERERKTAYRQKKKLW